MMWIVLPLLSGLLTGLSFNQPACSLLIWISFVPLFISWRDVSLRKGIFGAILFGIGYFCTALFWIAHVTSLGFIALLVYLLLYPVAFYLVGRKLVEGPFSVFALPALWVLLEFVRENVWCGFGWAGLGYSQYRHLYLIQIADLGGVKLISFLIIALNVILAEMVLRKKGTWKKLIGFVIVIGGCFIYSLVRLNGLPHKEDTVPVSLIQPNIPQDQKWNEGDVPNTIRQLTHLSKKVEKESLVIFPEAAWPLVITGSNYFYFEQFVRGFARDVLIGAVQVKDGNFYNSALLFHRDEGLIDTYRKITLVPFGEYVPLRILLGRIGVLNALGDMTAGSVMTSFPYGNHHFGVLICFEDVPPRFVTRFKGDNDFLVNITNDAWFGGNPEAQQHFAIMVLRAIENRISIVRAANTGVSGVVSALGEFKTLSIPDSAGKPQEVLVAAAGEYDVPLYDAHSVYALPYTEYGFLGVYIVLVLLGLVIKEKGPEPETQPLDEREAVVEARDVPSQEYPEQTYGTQ